MGNTHATSNRISNRKYTNDDNNRSTYEVDAGAHAAAARAVELAGHRRCSTMATSDDDAMSAKVIGRKRQHTSKQMCSWVGPVEPATTARTPQDTVQTYF